MCPDQPPWGPHPVLPTNGCGRCCQPVGRRGWGDMGREQHHACHPRLAPVLPPTLTNSFAASVNLAAALKGSLVLRLLLSPRGQPRVPQLADVLFHSAEGRTGVNHLRLPLLSARSSEGTPAVLCSCGVGGPVQEGLRGSGKRCTGGHETPSGSHTFWL